MEDVTQIAPTELVFLDAAHLAELARDRGVSRAENIANSAIEEIADRLTAVDAAWSAGEFARMQKVARSMVGLSEQMGMQTLAKVAMLVADAAEAGDDIALAAVVARLMRVGQASLNAVWDIGHLRL